MLKDFFRKIFKREPEIIDEMKYLIVGLGNPGNEYQDTRHNIGWLIIDALAEANDNPFKTVRYGLVKEVKHRGRKLILLKPTTYMNLSGNAVRYWLKQEKVNIENMIVVSDDLDIDFGAIRIKARGSGGSHNGLNNIIEVINTSNFTRLRFGIGNNFQRGKQVDFVLSKFTEEEQKTLQDRIKTAKDAIHCFVMEGVNRTMNKFNNK